MKKLLYLFIAITAIVFASCYTNKTETSDDVDTTEVVDTLSIDTLC